MYVRRSMNRTFYESVVGVERRKRLDCGGEMTTKSWTLRQISRSHRNSCVGVEEGLSSRALEVNLLQDE